MSPRVLNLPCVGAAQGLVAALQQRFTAETGATLQGRFGAVGALCGEGRLRGDSRRALGQVFTGVAVCEGVPPPDVSSPAALKAALLAADSLCFPDPQRATAGIHFASVMRELGVHEQLQPRLLHLPGRRHRDARDGRQPLAWRLGLHPGHRDRVHARRHAGG